MTADELKASGDAAYACLRKTIEEIPLNTLMDGLSAVGAMETFCRHAAEKLVDDHDGSAERSVSIAAERSVSIAGKLHDMKHVLAACVTARAAADPAAMKGLLAAMMRSLDVTGPGAGIATKPPDPEKPAMGYIENPV